MENSSSWERQLLRILSISDLGSNNLFEVAQDLSNVLGKLIIESSFVFRNFDVLNCYEKAGGSDTAKPVRISASVMTTQSSNRQIVSKLTASLDLPRESNLEVDCDHTELWRFGFDDDKSELICQRLRTTLDRVHKSNPNGMFGTQVQRDERGRLT
jgi:hypothetical protein